jgi:hypothetical protein
VPRRPHRWSDGLDLLGLTHVLNAGPVRNLGLLDRRRRRGGGEAFVDPGGDNVHMAYNPSKTEEAVIGATFLGMPAEGHLTVPVDEVEGAELDARCEIDR